MSDIFLSYATEDRERARTLAAAIEQAGRSVFWDRKVPAGLTWRQFIGEELQRARCVVVAWTAASIDSEWVLEEAETAKKKALLVPVFLEPVEAPFGFGSLHGPDLSAWDGGAQAPDFRQLLEDLERLLGPLPARSVESPPAHMRQVVVEPPTATSRPVATPATPHRRARARSAAGTGRLVLLGMAFGIGGAILGAFLGAASGNPGAQTPYGTAWGLSAAVTGILSTGRRVLRYGIAALVIVTVAAMVAVGPSGDATNAFGLLSPIAMALGTMIGRGLRSGRREG